MTTKPKIKLNNSTKYRFQYLLRHYHQALTLSHAGEYLQSSDLFRILDAMGYLAQQKCEKDYELVSSVTCMLSYPQGEGIVSQRNLFLFLMTVSDVKGNLDSHFQQQVQPLPKDKAQLEQPLIPIHIGTFTKEGIWKLTQKDEHKVKRIFGHMVYTRVSRHDFDTKKVTAEQQTKTSFQPIILTKSTIMAQHHYKKIGVEGRVEDRLLFEKNIYQNRRQDELRESRQKQLKECSFNPRVNSFSRKIQKQNSLNESKEEILLMKGKEYEVKKRMQIQKNQQDKKRLELSHCSFKPNLSLSFTSLRDSKRERVNSIVRNQEKSISRIKLAREERQGLNEVNKRGYPQGISWIQFSEQVKRKRAPNYQSQLMNSIPTILSIDLKILGEKKHIEVKQADKIECIAERICKESQLSNECYYKIMDMVEHSISQCPQIEIINRQIFIKNK